MDFIEDYREEALSMGLAKEKIQIEVPLPDPAMIEAITAVATEKIDAALRRCSEKDFPNKTGYLPGQC